jgi:pimeloyl-ACP methyl ester carboxylesterase
MKGLYALKRGLELTARLSPGVASSIAARLFLTPRRFPRPAREAALLERAQALPREHGISAWRWGHGAPVLLVHGWEGRGAQLGALVDPLVSAGLSVITFDAPAHGSSPGSTCTLVDIRDSIRALAHRFGPFAGIVAHSLGAPSTLLALDKGVEAASVVLVSPPIKMGRGVDWFTKMFSLSDEVRAGMQRHIEERAGLPFEAIDPLPIARRQKSPLLVVHDREDAEVPFSDAVALANAWPGAALRVVSGLGHRKILRDPDVVRTMVDFVSGFQPERPALVALERALGLDDDRALDLDPLAI